MNFDDVLVCHRDYSVVRNLKKQGGGISQMLLSDDRFYYDRYVATRRVDRKKRRASGDASEASYGPILVFKFRIII